MRKKKYKARGVVLLEAFLALMLMSMVAYGMAAVNSVQFSQLAASRDDNQAQNYAELEALYLKQLGYDEVVDDNYDIDEPSRPPRYPEGQNKDADTASNAREMTKFLGETLGAEWKSTATLGETIENIGGDQDNKIQNVIVSVYKTTDGAEATPRATVTVPLSTQGSSRVPVGGIIAWPKDSNPSTSSNIWLECNGQTFDTNRFPKLYKVLGSNKTPNFQGMFLRGAGSQTFTQNNGENVGNTSTVYSSGSVGAVQGDATRQIVGAFLNGPTANGYSSSAYSRNGSSTRSSRNIFYYTRMNEVFYSFPFNYRSSVGWGDPGHWSNALTLYRYQLSGSAESGYTLIETPEYFDTYYSYPDAVIEFDNRLVTPVSNEIRPANVAVKYYIRAK